MQTILTIAKTQVLTGLSRSELFAAVGRRELARPVYRGMRLKGWPMAAVQTFLDRRRGGGK